MIGTAHSDLLQTALNQKASIVNVSSISRLMASMFENRHDRFNAEDFDERCHRT